ncbi:MAG: 7-carboxy-7-deazaguanine synthase [Syntrophorhabdus sp. PtaB.Bin047]|jgi:7-carboxy-7-deazaguanine synthase (Cx14CxxC type)|nr:MAG: 7-carboxy-7-deazaguanine synthase [Syntrophorhabdus sp. PtaB.Bin047]
MAYLIKEIFYSLQGEGMNAGRPAVFLRFSGCNLWSGSAEDRPNIPCPFCDTDFVGTDGPGGGAYAATEEVASTMAALLPSPAPGGNRPLAVITGGEPALQLDTRLVDELHRGGWEVAVETNGTLPLPGGIDWITVSPKTGTRLVVTTGDELKLLYPQAGLDPASLEGLPFRHFILQPIDNSSLGENTRLAIDYCLTHPRWRLGLQLHKMLKIK